jgi:hypothetical protein
VKRIKLAKGEALMLRTCNPDGTSYDGFVWPKSGPVECPDWNDEPRCGNGLHGLLWGAGDGLVLNWGDAAWVVARVKLSQVVEINRKIKVPKAIVEYFGTREEATALISRYAPAGTLVVGGTSTSGYRGTSTSGDRGTSTSGDGGTSTSGDGGTSTSGYRGTSTSGDGGTSTSGYRGTSTSGDRGTSTSGYRGTSTSGDGGVLSILYWNGEKYKRAIFAVGENGIKPNVPYKVDNAGNPIKEEIKKSS